MKETFIKRIRKYTDLPNLRMDMSFKKDLFLDSLTFTKLIIEFEEYYHIEFDDDTYIGDGDFKLQDLYDLLSAKVGVA